MKKNNNGDGPSEPATNDRPETTKSTKYPSLDQEAILTFLRSHHGRASKAEIARHFGVTGNDRIGLKAILKDMLAKGRLHHGSFRSFMTDEHAKKLVKDANDAERDARLAKRGIRADDRDAPPSRRRREEPAPEAEQKPRRNIREENHDYSRFVGLYEPLANGGGLVNPVSRLNKNPIVIADGKNKNARSGDLVQAIETPRGWEVEELLSERDDAGMVSLMAIRTLNIPYVFPPEALAETENISVPPLGKRTDLRDVPFVTIDGDDSRDFDDAVYAEPDDAADNKKGWKIYVGIADVSHYVQPGSALDQEAYKRGNSVYFPDRVVPMLPESLSNDLCSLRPNEPRACMAALMRINQEGELIGTQIVRGLMRSHARLTYNQVQQAFDGNPDSTTKPLLDSVLMPLYHAYKTLLRAREARGTVDLDLPERRVFLVNGEVQDIISKPRYDSHKLIEEMMILANVAVAKEFEKKRQQALFRVHPRPDSARWAVTREFLQELGLKTKPGLHPKPDDLKSLITQVEGKDEAPLVNDMILRSMAQASYAPENIGHFGLALEHYSHFTSPIRRYADLIVHRALIRAFNLGDDGLTDYEQNRLTIIGEHISDRERVAQAAERETIDRYIALFLEDKVGATFNARVSGVTNFGLFVNVDPMGADGMIPLRMLPDDYYIHDEKRHSLVGRRTGLTFRLAMPLVVRLLEVDSGTGRLLMELVPGSIAIPERRGERRYERTQNKRDPYADPPRGFRRSASGPPSRNGSGKDGPGNGGRGKGKPNGKFKSRNDRGKPSPRGEF